MVPVCAAYGFNSSAFRQFSIYDFFDETNVRKKVGYRFGLVCVLKCSKVEAKKPKFLIERLFVGVFSISYTIIRMYIWRKTVKSFYALVD